MNKNRMLACITAMLIGVTPLNCYAEEDPNATTASSTVYADDENITIEQTAESDQSAADSPEAEVETENLAPQVDVLAEIADAEPVTGDMLKDGMYQITAASSSTMFKITDCILMVEDGEMTAIMTMSGKGYLYLYMGKGIEAAVADEGSLISFEEDALGNHTFTVPVEALDKGIDCAAYSKKKEKWYDRTLVFESAGLPEDAFQEGLVKNIDSLGLEDGTYQIDVVLGSEKGKAQVDSPALLTITDGQAYATIVFSSGKYDYVIADGQKQEAVEGAEKATFILPVSTLDRKVPITADSTVMIPATEIEYTLTFDSASITEAE